jgi:hypothetical protein
MSIGTSHGEKRPEPKPVTAVEVPEFPAAKPILEIVMAARPFWKGSLKLSLVSCPVLLYPASTNVEKTRFPRSSAKQSLKGRASAAKRPAPAQRSGHRPAKKVHRSAARARKAG